MPTSLTLVTANSTISATALQQYARDVELYCNESIASTDRGSAWCTANHVYRPDFYGAPDPHTTLVSGETYFRSTGISAADRVFFSYYLGDGPFPVPGLQVPIQLPESLQQGSVYYRMVVTYSFYCYEYGGSDDEVLGVLQSGLNEDNNHAATFHLGVGALPTAIRDNTTRELYKGSLTEDLELAAYYPRKQHSGVWAFAGDVSGIGVGMNSVGIYVRPRTPATTSPSLWKHIVIAQGSIIVRYKLR